MLLDGRPTPSGTTDERRRAIADYWNGQARRGTFDALLGGFLASARDEEGAWAYTRLVSSARTFSALNPDEGRPTPIPGILRSRLIASAALLDLDRAAFPMELPQASMTGALSTHDYGMALAAVARLGEAAPLLVAAPVELAGIEPDEIDVAVAVAAERAPDTTVTDEGNRRFAAALDAVLGTGVVSASDLDRLESESAALRGAIAALQVVTLVRFQVTRGP